MDKNHRLMKNSQLLKICGNNLLDSFIINMNHNSNIHELYSFPLLCKK